MVEAVRDTGQVDKEFAERDVEKASETGAGVFVKKGGETEH